MQNKKRLHKHLLAIYVLYFVVLIIGFAASFAPNFSRGWRDAQTTMHEDMTRGGVRSYYVHAPIAITQSAPLIIDGLPEGVTPSVSEISMKVKVNEIYTMENSVKSMANNGYAYLLIVVTALSYLAILVLITLIINSLRKSIRDEQPLKDRNIMLTRIIGVLIIVAELCETASKYINMQEASRLLEGTNLQVAQTIPLSYWNIVMGILFLFMAEVISITTQLSEEQKLTI